MDARLDHQRRATIHIALLAAVYSSLLAPPPCVAGDLTCGWARVITRVCGVAAPRVVARVIRAWRAGIAAYVGKAGVVTRKTRRPRDRQGLLVQTSECYFLQMQLLFFHRRTFLFFWVLVPHPRELY